MNNLTAYNIIEKLSSLDNISIIIEKMLNLSFFLLEYP